jgi:hypothetical protein
MKNMAPAWALTLPGLAVRARALVFRAQRPRRGGRDIDSCAVYNRLVCVGVHAASLPIAFVSALAIGPAGRVTRNRAILATCSDSGKPD